MTHKEKLIELFRLNGYRLTLGFLLNHPSGCGYKAASRFADLRKDGWVITFTKGKTASENSYQAYPPEVDGQRRFA